LVTNKIISDGLAALKATLLELRGARMKLASQIIAGTTRIPNAFQYFLKHLTDVPLMNSELG
jgi:hypothetical protein